jgi:hypothetical protein
MFINICKGNHKYLNGGDTRAMNMESIEERTIEEQDHVAEIDQEDRNKLDELEHDIRQSKVHWIQKTYNRNTTIYESVKFNAMVVAVIIWRPKFRIGVRKLDDI